MGGKKMENDYLNEEIPVFNEEQMLRLVKKDVYLTFVFNDLSKRNQDRAYVLEVIFNSNVLEDSIYTNQYTACSIDV
jgi:hypothetical protein